MGQTDFGNKGANLGEVLSIVFVILKLFLNVLTKQSLAVIFNGIGRHHILGVQEQRKDAWHTF